LSQSGSFHFACHDSLPCFTQCCRDVNIYLTPYDVLRMRRALKMGSAEFLGKYTRHFLAKKTHIPIVQLLMDADTLCCQLVTQQGCSVYADRPWACRMYPLDLGSRPGEYAMIVGKERCFGLLEPTLRTVAEWLDNQGVQPYVEMEQAFQAVMPADFKPGSSLDPGLGKLLFLAYDLDRFREILRDQRLQTCYDIDEALLEQAQTDDEALLHLAFRYIRSQLEELSPIY
jgi:hypothetical protein